MIDNAELLQDVLDVVVLESRDGMWRSQYPLPGWFTKSLLARPRNYAANQFPREDTTSPFFDFVLESALDLPLPGEGDNTAPPKEIWTEELPEGEQIYLKACARHWRGNLIVMVWKLDANLEGMRERLQAAREELLSNERLEAEVFRRTQAIRDREEEVALRLLAASQAHDTETGSHVRRIGLYSAAIAELLGWSVEQVADLRVAAPMHDIGKIGIPDSVLKKPGKLEEDEWAIMQTHTAVGARILASDDVPLLQMASEIAYCHHEKYDGTGYPRGLVGDDIPVAARIVAIVDVYDALVHRRVYKNAIDEGEVIDTMRNLEGSHFDPALLSLFIENLPTMRRIRLENPDEPLVSCESVSRAKPSGRG